MIKPFSFSWLKIYFYSFLMIKSHVDLFSKIIHGLSMIQTIPDFISALGNKARNFEF